MISFVIKRLLVIIPILWVVVTAVFFLARLSGDPVDFILGDGADPVLRQEVSQKFGFDKPVTAQYMNYVKDVLKGNLGRSYYSDQPVTAMIARRFGATCELAFAALAWALAISFPLGMIAAVRRESLWDKGILVFSLLGISVPGFYLGPLLVLIFSIKLDWFPLSGRGLPGSIVLPSLALGLALSAILTRMVRASLVEVLHHDYIRTARAKGVHPAWVVIKHATRAALIPVIAVIGLQIGTLLTGAVVTEKIFNWPGLGSLMLESISQRDFAQVQGCVLFIAATYVLVNLLTDVVYHLVDPRLRAQA